MDRRDAKSNGRDNDSKPGAPGESCSVLLSEIEPGKDDVEMGASEVPKETQSKTDQRSSPHTNTVDEGDSGIEGSTQSHQQQQHKQTVSNPNPTPRPQSQLLSVTSDSTPTRTAAFAMLFCVFANTIKYYCCSANYAMMIYPGAHKESFPNTDPFDFTTAQYMVVSAYSTGSFISSLSAGWISGRIGQRRVVLANMLGAFIFTSAQYMARHTYWGFVGVGFLNGLFSSTSAVALGYMAEIFHDDRVKADAYMGHVMSITVLGMTAGGLLAVAFPSYLFRPLVPGALICACGIVVAYMFVLDPEEKKQAKEAHGEDKNPPHNKIDTVAVTNIIFGAILDNAGSQGLVPLALSPLMFRTFLLNFVEEGGSDDPVMSEQTYRWLFALIGICVVPGALASPYLYQKFGVALSCASANLFTACIIICLLYVTLIEPVTTTTFAIFSTVLYLGFPLTVISQLSTGPMLDRLCPPEHRAFVQGINGSISDGSAAIFPLVYALFVDRFGIFLMLWVAAGISLLAALVNMPLVYHPLLCKKKLPTLSTTPAEESITSESDDDDVDVINYDQNRKTNKEHEIIFLHEDDDDMSLSTYSC